MSIKKENKIVSIVAATLIGIAGVMALGVGLFTAFFLKDLYIFTVSTRVLAILLLCIIVPFILFLSTLIFYLLKK